MRAALALRTAYPRDILEQLEEKRMLLRSRFSKKLFWTNFCLIVPVLSVSIIMFTLIVMEMRRMGQEDLRSQADNAVTRLETYYSMYNEESILLSERWELLPYRIDATPQQTRQGIELLRMKRYFDSRIKDVFLCKGTEYAFSSMGLSSKRVHFASNLNCGEESVLQGLAAIECPEDSLTLLFQQDAVVRKGYLMYSYVTRQLEDGHVSIHFVLPFEQVGELLQPLDGEQWYQLEDRNGSIVAMGCDDSGKMTVLSEEEWEGRLQSGRYSVIEKTMEGFGFAVRLYHRKSSGDMRSGLYRMQAVNMALIIAGISLSAAISRRLNRRRMEEIRYLEDIAGGNPGRAFPTNSIYSSLEHIIRSGLEDARLLEKRVLEGGRAVAGEDRAYDLPRHGGLLGAGHGIPEAGPERGSGQLLRLRGERRVAHRAGGSVHAAGLPAGLCGPGGSSGQGVPVRDPGPGREPDPQTGDGRGDQEMSAPAGP